VASAYLPRLRRALPAEAGHPTAGDWVHEIKHDGMRLLARRAAGRVRLHDWTERYPSSSRR